MTNFLIRLVLLAFLVNTAFGIFCHVCQSTEHSDCLDPFAKDSNKHIKNCTDEHPNAKFCRKIDQTVNGERRIFRRCAWEEHKKYDCYFNSAEYYKTEICICREDGCNSGPKMAANGPLIILATTLLSAIITTKIISGH